MPKKRAKTTAAPAEMDDAADDYKPSPHEGFCSNERLSKEMIARVASPFPLEIRPSPDFDGSGLFAGGEIDPGREIYRAVPDLAALNAGNETICDWCFVDTKPAFGVATASTSRAEVKACSQCKVARFCSKECQKMAWAAHHKDECKILQATPEMKPQHLLAHRLFFWAKRGHVLGRAYVYLETHFEKYSKDADRANEILDMAMAVHEVTGRKASLDLIWRTVPALRVNCHRLRSPANVGSVGCALEFLTTVINHSCDPNAFVFFEGRQLYVRSLRPIAPGEEITICYVDPTFDISARQEILKREHFFDCDCSRCASEVRIHSALFDGNIDLDRLEQAQRQIRDLLRSAVRASKHPGIYPDLDDLANVETRLRTITSTVFPSGSVWPEYMEPLPAARLSLAMLYLEQGKPVPALRCALKGKFLSVRADGGPEWFNEMVDVLTILIVVGSLPADAVAFEDATCPDLESIRTVTYGYLFEMLHEVSALFGADARYARDFRELFGGMMQKKAGAEPESREFKEEFQAAQAKLMDWAGVKVVKGTVSF